MDSTNNNNNQSMFLCEFKELRKELSAVKKRIVQLEVSHEKQQERLEVLERENHNISGSKEGASVLKRKREEKDQEKETESKSTSVSAGKKKTKTNNNDNKEAVVIPQRDNGDSFDSLSDDLLHKIVEFDGNCYEKFGSINKRCKNIYDVKEYKLKKQTCLYGYGTVEMMLQDYLKQRREGTLNNRVKVDTARAVIWYNCLDAIDWIVQLGDIDLLGAVCMVAAECGRIKILTKVFCKSNLTILDQILSNTGMCYFVACNGKLETLKWLRNHGAKLDADTFIAAREEGHDEIVQYLRLEGCPEPDEDGDY